MTFISPAFLWAFAALVPLTAIYFLKVRPTRKPVTAYFLWQRVFSEKKATRLFHRLRDALSLLLMLIAAAAIVLALSGPQITDDDRKDLLILIDQSASMSAVDGGKPRLDTARQVARDIVHALSANQRAAIASVAGNVIYQVHFTDNPREMLDAIDRIGQTDFTLATAALVPLGDDAWVKDRRILLITDGCLPAEEVPKNIELMKVGSAVQNVGIVAGDLQFLPTGPGRMALYFQVASSYEKPVEADLVLTHHGSADRIMKVIPLTIAPGVNKPEVYPIDGGEAGKWTAKIELDDALLKDNTLFLAAAAPRPVRIAVRAEDRFFFEHSVLAFSHAAGLLALTEESPQVILAKGLDPASSSSVNGGFATPPLSIIFKPSGNSPCWSELGDEISAAVPRLMIEEHPVLRHVDVVSMPFLGARRLKAPPGALVLVASDEGVPLIYRVNHAGRAAMVVNMDPAAGEFYFSAWFPVLVHSMATHLAGREEPVAAAYSPAAIAPIPGQQEGSATRIATPEGAHLEISAATYDPLSIGFHEISNSSGRWLIACSLLSPAESQLNNASTADTSRPLSRGWAPATWLTALAIAILAIECLLYHRRKVG